MPKHHGGRKSGVLGSRLLCRKREVDGFEWTLKKIQMWKSFPDQDPDNDEYPMPRRVYALVAESVDIEIESVECGITGDEPALVLLAVDSASRD